MPASRSNLATQSLHPGRSGAMDFEFPDQIPIDAAHTLDQLMARFRTVRDGLPELIKNAKDQYSRLGIVDRELRQIVVLVDTDAKRLGVIDFAGARLQDFEGWTTWSSRIAGRPELSNDIEAGHGNGGKAFMVRGATEFAFLESCFEGKRTRMGFRNDRLVDRYKPGFVRVRGATIEGINEPNPTARLREFLAEFRISKLPRHPLEAFNKRHAFTGVLLSEVAEWQGRQKRTVNRSAEAIIEIIASHGQTAMTVETCDVWVVIDGKLRTREPIRPIALTPYPGFEQPIEFPIPDLLPDPETGDAIDTTAVEGDRYLKLFTSARQLQMSEETKARNVIRVWNNRNNVANWPLHSLGVLVTSVSFVYGEVRCPALIAEHLAGAERHHLADTPLTRALIEWTRQKVKELAEDLHRAMMAENRPRDRAQAKAALERIRDLMKKFLDAEVTGITDEGGHGKLKVIEVDRPGKQKSKRTGAKFGSRIDEIVLEPGRARISLARGTSVPLLFTCIELQPDGTLKPVKDRSICLKADNPGLVTLNGDRIAANAAGITEIWLEDSVGAVSSNRVVCEVVSAIDVHVGVPVDVLLQGQRLKLPVTFETANGPRDNFLIEGSIDEPGMGLIGRHGRFTAGYREGEATVRIRFGDAPHDQRTTVLHIGRQRILKEVEGGGSDIPQILLCGEEAPGMEDFPKEQRTLPGGEELPTIIEDPLFQNVVWINPNSKEATRVRRSHGGPAGVSGIATRNFMHFVALKCFDILKRLYVRQQLKDQTVTEYQFIQAAVAAEMECADFIDAAWELSDQLLGRAEAALGQA